MSEKKLEVVIEGMHCRSCEVLVAQNFGDIPGVKKVKVSSSTGKAVIFHEEGQEPDLHQLQAAVKAAGYRVRAPGDAAGACPTEEPNSIWELGAYFLLAGVVVWLLERSRALPDVAGAGTAGFWSAAFVGLLAGATSCIAVSGGLLLTAAAKYNERSAARTTSGRMVPVGLFIAGRILSYALFGGLIGALGSVLIPSLGFTGVLVIVAALIMLVMGLDMLKIAPRGLRAAIPSLPSSVAHKLALFGRSAGPLAPFLLGAATFFLPCGFTQAFQVYALSTHSFAAGAAIMVGFAIGTAPALALVGWLTGALKGQAGRMFLKFAGALVIIFGIINLRAGWALIGPATPRQVPASGVSVGADDGLPPLVDGRQVIKMTVGGRNGAYDPDRFTVRAGTPVRWEIDQQTSSGCLSFVVSRGLGISSPLKLGANVVEFTPAKAGNYSFSCSMGMYTGVITVVP